MRLKAREVAFEHWGHSFAQTLENLSMLEQGYVESKFFMKNQTLNGIPEEGNKCFSSLVA